jgi:hypothetical protein
MPVGSSRGSCSGRGVRFSPISTISPSEALPIAAADIAVVNRLLAVLDDPTATGPVRDQLSAAGVPPEDVVVLHGHEDLERFRASVRGGAWRRTIRFLSFIAADQAVDMAWYEAALSDGRAILVMRVPGTELRHRAVAALRRAGAHFVNHYGRLATVDIAPWRGPPPPVHWVHHR